MGAPEFAIAIIAALASVAAALAYAVLSREKPSFFAAKVLSWASAIGFGSLGVIWGSTNSTVTLGWRVAAAASLGAVVAAALTWVLADISGQPKRTVEPSDTAAVARLAELGWTVKPGQDDYLFEIAGQSLPSMEQSAGYFKQLKKPFRLHFQSVKGLQGLHNLADAEGCATIEINAGEFTDLSELTDFKHLTKLILSQVPLNGIGTVETAPLATLVNLVELNLNMTRVRDVDFLSSLPALKMLYLGQTLIRDITPASTLRSLELLEIRGTRVTDLQPLEKSEHLRELWIGGEQIPSIVNLSSLGSLKRLSVIEQRAADLTPIGSLTGLEDLWIWGLPQFDLSPIRHLDHLRNLQLSGLGFNTTSPVRDVQAISTLKTLRALTLGSLQINDLSFLQGLDNLEELNLNTLPIASITLLGTLPSLKKLSLVGTFVVDVSPLLELPKLSEINVIRTPARVDVLSELERRGVKVTR
jgi:Leucine-rich repeat (LRR) protein